MSTAGPHLTAVHPPRDCVWQTPDSSSTPPTYNIGRVLDVHGDKVTAPWMRSWSPVPYWGCANNPAYQAIALARYKLLVDAGADSIQHDDAGMNADATAYGGCFCSYCVTGFSEYLNRTLTAKQLAAFGINDTATFSYKEYVLEHGSSTGLQPYFQQYQVDSVVKHYQTVRAAAVLRVPVATARRRCHTEHRRCRAGPRAN